MCNAEHLTISPYIFICDDIQERFEAAKELYKQYKKDNLRKGMLKNCGSFVDCDHIINQTNSNRTIQWRISECSGTVIIRLQI